MRRILKNESVLKNCKIFRMLTEQADRAHTSFHMPGHKESAWDITELSYSDNLSSPVGCIREAEEDIAKILGAHKSFLLTDGSTSGVLSTLYAAKLLGVKKIAVCEASHKSVFNGCVLAGIEPLVYPQKKEKNIPFGYTVYELNELYPALLQEADALFLTSPDYYGNIADLVGARAFCDKHKKLLLVDGAHGGHLHFDKEIYAGAYADIWVDGVHKSLPALTQGAVVSAREERFADPLFQGVQIFRTTSPSYPIMASVEYAVKYPRNEELENTVKNYAKTCPRIRLGGDWTKLCALFGQRAFQAAKELEGRGIYPEFCDGNIIEFYLSPVNTQEEFFALTREIERIFEKYPFAEVKEIESVPAPLLLEKDGEMEWVKTEKAEGRICAQVCGLFPPCTPLIRAGEKVKKEHISLLCSANHTFGLKEGEIAVLKEKKRE